MFKKYVRCIPYFINALSVLVAYLLASLDWVTSLNRLLNVILKDFRNAPPAKMLIYCQNVIF